MFQKIFRSISGKLIIPGINQPPYEKIVFYPACLCCFLLQLF